VDNPTFRQLFSEFDDPAVSSDVRLTYLFALAASSMGGSVCLGSTRWGDMYDWCTGLFVAHFLTVMVRNNKRASAGGTPGEVTGPISSKTVDKVTVARDTKAVTVSDSPFWNSTSYGVELLTWASMAGAGGVQLGVQSTDYDQAVTWGLQL
jgi:hypothetical protein